MRAAAADPGRRTRLRWSALAVVLAGVAGAYAFPQAGVWPLAFASAAALGVAVDGLRCRTGAWLGMLYGLGFFVPLLHWTGVYVGAIPWLLLAVAEAVFMAGLGAVLTLVQRLPAAPLWVGCAWVLEEFLRDRIPFGGFPWGRLAFSQASGPLRWFAPLGGAPLVTCAVALAAGFLTVAVRRLRPLRIGGLALAVAAAVAVPLLGGVLSGPLGPAPDRDGRTAVVALVQGNVPARGLVMENRAGQVLDNHARETERLAADVRAGRVPKPALVVWPENSSDLDPFTDPAAYRVIDTAVKDIGVPVLIGAILQGPGPTHRRNVGILWSPTTGPGAQYVKRHPVPFGEYIPLRSLAQWVSPDAKLVTEDMVAGHGNGLLRGGPFPIGDVICFEVAYDSLVNSSVRAGAQVLVVQTNNSTFGFTSETYQQLAMSRLRAVEEDRTVLQVATTGKSAVIGPNGGVREQSGALFTPDLIVARVPLRTVETLAARLGGWPERVLSVLAVLAGAASVGLQRWRRVGGPDRVPEEKVSV